KRPSCPDRLVWRGETFQVVTLLASWHDFGRRGRMAQNMRPERLTRAARLGSWGVGRYFFRVRVVDAAENGREFEFYYDRAPKDADDRLGSWYLTRENEI
ncbi:MAG: hypothetical protein KC425_26530, partial [Anaerolineales bacterium]|nr:hypothetical protein [Anaerolineales bacterium]